MKKPDLHEAAKLLAAAHNICVLTGAGISAESGIPTFRDSNGLWNNYPVEKVATPEAFFENPSFIWNFYNDMRCKTSKAEPNNAHKALVTLEKQPAASGKNRTVSIITQNVDGLHRRAGSSRVVEIHGSIWKARCPHCDYILPKLSNDAKEQPICKKCKSLLRPDIVWFGEQLDPHNMAQAEIWAMSCDLFLSVGTSAKVFPAAQFAYTASETGIPLIEVNKEPTPLSAITEYSFMGKAGEILPQMLQLSSAA